MKKFLKRISLFLGFCLLMSVIPSVAVDPFNVFHWRHIRSTQTETNKNYVKTRYILTNPEKFDTLLFGSSRGGAIHVENIPGARAYNMTSSDATPTENLDTIRTLLDGGVKLKKIYISVDSRSYTVDPEAHKSEPMRAPYRYLKEHPLAFARLYLDPTTLTGFYLDGANKPGKQDVEVFYRYGWWRDYGLSPDPNLDQKGPSIGPGDYLEPTLQAMADIVALCRERKVELVVFVGPMYKVTYQASVERDFHTFLTRLAEITDYYNFSGLNGITTDGSNFVDNSHYTAEVGDRLLRAMTGGGVEEALYRQGFGWYVTKDNVSQLLEIME